jgi:hypothetical protein
MEENEENLNLGRDYITIPLDFKLSGSRSIDHQYRTTRNSIASLRTLLPQQQLGCTSK